MYLFRDYIEKWDKNRGYIEIFRAYVVRKWSIQAHFAYALTLKPTEVWIPIYARTAQTFQRNRELRTN